MRELFTKEPFRGKKRRHSTIKIFLVVKELFFLINRINDGPTLVEAVRSFLAITETPIKFGW